MITHWRICRCAKCMSPTPIPETPRARLLRVQAEVNSLFTEVHDSGVTGLNVMAALVRLREILKAIDNAMSHIGRL